MNTPGDLYRIPAPRFSSRGRRRLLALVVVLLVGVAVLVVAGVQANETWHNLSGSGDATHTVEIPEDAFWFEHTSDGTAAFELIGESGTVARRTRSTAGSGGALTHAPPGAYRLEVAAPDDTAWTVRIARRATTGQVLREWLDRVVPVIRAW